MPCMPGSMWWLRSMRQKPTSASNSRRSDRRKVCAPPSNGAAISLRNTRTDMRAMLALFSGRVMEFWTEPQMASIHKMLNPRSIAIVGATPRMQYGGRFLAAALKAKERVRVYAVNPRYDEIMGEKSYPSVTDLPEAPDVVAGVVGYCPGLEVLQESHRKGAGSAIVISAGFAERDVDDRRDLQGELGEFARASGDRKSTRLNSS